MVWGMMVNVLAHVELPGVQYGGSFVDLRLGLLCPNQGLLKNTVLLDYFLEGKCSRV